MPFSKPILIAGAGLAGCLMAVEVVRLGYRVVVIEKRRDDEINFASGRSINLALAPSTLRLLADVAGLAGELAKLITPLQGRVLHPTDGPPVFQPYSEPGGQASLLNPPAGAVSVSRAELNALLRRVAAQNSNIEFRFGQRVVGCDAERAEVLVEGLPGNDNDETYDHPGNARRELAEVVIAADGSGSAIRRLLARRQGLGICEERTALKHGYKELSFPNCSSVHRPALHIWPRTGFLMMALPNMPIQNQDGSFRGAIFLPRGGKNSFRTFQKIGAIRHFFSKHFPDVSDLDGLAEQFANNPVSSLSSIRSDPWHVGRVVLIGDACHTLYPFSGQGANLALEDCAQLAQCIEQFAPAWPRVFATFTESRKPQIDYLVEATRAISPLLLSALPQEGILAQV